MARKHARLLVSIWDDPDFLALDATCQVLYLHICSSPDLSWAGVVPLLPQRFAVISKGLTERKTRAALDTLTADRFLLVEERTAEVAVRTFVRHDEVMKVPNVAKAVGRAYGTVRSTAIRDSIVTELARYLTASPEERGWPTLQLTYPELFSQVGEKALPNPSPNPSVNPSTKGA